MVTALQSSRFHSRNCHDLIWIPHYKKSFWDFSRKYVESDEEESDSMLYYLLEYIGILTILSKVVKQRNQMYGVKWSLRTMPKWLSTTGFSTATGYQSCTKELWPGLCRVHSLWIKHSHVQAPTLLSPQNKQNRREMANRFRTKETNLLWSCWIYRLLEDMLLQIRFFHMHVWCGQALLVIKYCLSLGK